MKMTKEERRMKKRIKASLAAAAYTSRRPQPNGWKSPIEDEWPLAITSPIPWKCEPVNIWPTHPVGRASPKI